MRHITRTMAGESTDGQAGGTGTGTLAAGRRQRRGTRLLVAGVTAATLALAGCGGDGDPIEDLPSPTARPSLPGGLPTSLPTGLPTALPTGLPTSIPTALPTSIPGIGSVSGATGAEALKGTNIPPDFPVPPGATVSVGGTAGSRSTLTMRDVAPDTVRQFYRQALPAAGYEITSDHSVPGFANTLAFRGHGVTGTIAAAGVGSADAIAAVFEKN